VNRHAWGGRREGGREGERVYLLRLVLGGKRRPEVTTDVGEPDRDRTGGQSQGNDRGKQDLGRVFLLCEGRGREGGREGGKVRTFAVHVAKYQKNAPLSLPPSLPPSYLPFPTLKYGTAMFQKSRSCFCTVSSWK